MQTQEPNWKLNKRNPLLNTYLLKFLTNDDLKFLTNDDLTQKIKNEKKINKKLHG